MEVAYVAGQHLDLRVQHGVLLGVVGEHRDGESETLRDASAAFRARVRLVPLLDPADPDLLGIADLVRSPDLVEALLDATTRRLERDHGTTPPRPVVATRALHDYAWPATLLLSAPWFLQGRVPLMRHSDVSLRLSTGVLEVAPVERVDGGEPDAALIAAVAEHHGPVVAALGRHLRRGPRAVWGLVTDDLVSGIWHLGRELGDEAAGVWAAERLLPSATGPFPGGACFRQAPDEDGLPHTTRTRLTCCLHYRIAADACTTCPRRS